MGFVELEKILSRVEEVFLDFAAQSRLRGVRIERWRWDEPDITLTWVDPDNISRSIHAVIEQGPPSTLELEVNAWQDEEGEEGKIRIRHWKHSNIARLKIPYELEYLSDAVKQGFGQVGSWTKSSLEVTYLSPQHTG